MAVETVKSGVITNRDATPRVTEDSRIAGGSVWGACGTVEVAASASSTSKYIFLSIPSNAANPRIWLLSDDLGTTTSTADVGLYRNTADGGAVVDADFFCSAISLAATDAGPSALTTGVAQGVEVTHESGVFNIDDIEKPIWQALGLSADPGVIYDVVVTLTAAVEAAGGGTLSMKATWIV